MSSISEQLNWPDGLSIVLVELAKSSNFDWEKVSLNLTQLVSDSYNGEDKEELLKSFTSKSCREVFSEVYPKLTQESNNKSEEISSSDNNSSPSSSSSSFTQEYIDSLSLEELVEFIDKKQSEYDDKKNQIFSKVLQTFTTTLNEHNIDENIAKNYKDSTIISYEQNLIRKQEEEQKLLQKKLINEENLLLEKQRKELKDNKIIHDEFLENLINNTKEEIEETEEDDPIYNYFNKYKTSSNTTTNSNDTNEDIDGLQDTIQLSMSALTLEGLIGEDDIDNLLTYYEDKYMNQSVDKSDSGKFYNPLSHSNFHLIFFFFVLFFLDDDGPSELAEILAYLEDQANSNSSIKQQNESLQFLTANKRNNEPKKVKEETPNPAPVTPQKTSAPTVSSPQTGAPINEINKQNSRFQIYSTKDDENDDDEDEDLWAKNRQKMKHTTSSISSATNIKPQEGIWTGGKIEYKVIETEEDDPYRISPLVATPESDDEVVEEEEEEEEVIEEEKVIEKNEAEEDQDDESCFDYQETVNYLFPNSKPLPTEEEIITNIIQENSSKSTQILEEIQEEKVVEVVSDTNIPSSPSIVEDSSDTGSLLARSRTVGGKKKGSLFATRGTPVLPPAPPKEEDKIENIVDETPLLPPLPPGLEVLSEKSLAILRGEISLEDELKKIEEENKERNQKLEEEKKQEEEKIKNEMKYDPYLELTSPSFISYYKSYQPLFTNASSLLTPQLNLSYLPYTSFYDPSKKFDYNFPWLKDGESKDICFFTSVLVGKIKIPKELSEEATILNYHDYFLVTILSWLHKNVEDTYRLLSFWREYDETSNQFSYTLLYEVNRQGEFACAADYRGLLYETKIEDLQLDQDNLLKENKFFNNTLKIKQLNEFINLEDYLSSSSLILSSLDYFKNSSGSLIQTPNVYYNYDENNKTNEELKNNKNEFESFSNKISIKLSQELIQGSSLVLFKPDPLTNLPSISAITSLIIMSEKKGLKLTGLNYLYLTLNDLNFLEKNLLHHFKFLTEKDFKNFNENEKLPYVALSFSLSSNLNMSSSSSNSLTSDILRDLIGSEDYSLSLKTDPNSLRSHFGRSDFSLCYNPSYFIKHHNEEIRQFFSASSSNPSTVSSVSKFVLPLLSHYSVTFSLSSSFYISSGALSYVQDLFFRYFLSTFEVNSTSLIHQESVSHDILKIFESYLKKDDKEFDSLLFSYNNNLNLKNENDSHNIIFHFSSYLSGLYIEELWNNFIKILSENNEKISSFNLSINFFSMPNSLIISKMISLENNKLSTSKIISSSLSFDLLLNHSKKVAKATSSLPSITPLDIINSIRNISEERFKSHEDIGFPDIILIQIKELNEISPSLNKNLIHKNYLNNILRSFPSSAHCCVLGVVTDTDERTNLKETWIVLRGHHSHETMTNSLNSLRSALNSELTTSERFTLFKNNVSMPLPSVPSNKLHDNNKIKVSYFVGKNSLEKILSKFSLSSLYFSCCKFDFNNFLSFGSLLFNNKNISQLELSCHLLFPPSTSMNFSILALPWHNSSSSTKFNSNSIHMKILSRTLSYLEKNYIEVVAMKTVNSLSSEFFNILYGENEEEIIKNEAEYYNYFSSSVTGSSISNKNSVNFKDLKENLSGLSYTLILIQSNSILLRLKNIIGPSYFSQAYNDSSYQYCLSSFLSTIYSNNNIELNNLPPILYSFTQKKTMELCSEVFSAYSNSITSYNNNLLQLYLHETSSASSLNGLTYNEISSLLFYDTPLLNLNHDIELEKKLLGKIPPSKKILDLNLNQNISSNNSYELVCIVLSLDLIKQNGLNNIIESLHKENIYISSLITSTLTQPMVKNLIKTSGSSSLSMHGKEELFLNKPCFILGLIAPTLTLSRIQSLGLPSFSLATYHPAVSGSSSNHSLWKLEKNNGEKTENNNKDWGVIATSSTRLARELYALCFDEILGLN